MGNILHRDPKTLVPDFIEWFEESFLTMRPYLGHAIKVEDCLPACKPISEGQIKREIERRARS
jgi:hypothetical protein